MTIDRFGIGQMLKQADKQRNISIRLDRQMQIGAIGRHRPARIDQYDFHFRPFLFSADNALIDNGVTPGEV